MDEIPKIILQNPFRILGVYANSAKKDIVKNKGKATAFLKVNKPVEFPLDLKGILPQITRTLEAMNEAEGRLAIAKEQIIYAQFWFLKMTSIDDVAFNHLLANDIDKAISIWSKQDNLSSLQNRVICYLIKGLLSEAISTAELLYNSFGNSYIEKIDSSSTLKMSVAELRNLFIDSLGEEIGMMNLLKVATDEDWKTYINKQTIEPLISNISSEVEKAKNTDHKDPQARLNAARKLYSATKKAFSQLKSLLASSGPQYQMIADKLGLELLQCGIDYYNNSDDDDAAHTAMKVQKQAQAIVAGTLAKQRCEENVKILQKIIDELPPREIINEYNSLMELIANFVNPPQEKATGETSASDSLIEILNRASYSSLFTRSVGPPSRPTLPDVSENILDFLKQIRPFVVAMKEKVGNNEPHYVKICSLIGSVAISKSVDCLNNAQDILGNWNKKVAGSGGYSLGTMHYLSLIGKYKSIVSRTWEALQLIDLMDVSLDFREERLAPNMNALESIANNVGVALPVSAKDPTFFYIEEDFYNTCNTYNDYCNYVNRFPNGRFVNAAKQKMTDVERKEFNKCVSLSSFINFVNKYPYSSFVKKAKEEIERLEFSECKNYKDFYDYLKKYPNGIYSTQAKEKLRSIEKEIANELGKISTVSKCRALYMKYGADPDGKIDKTAYSLCRSKRDFYEYADTFTISKAEAQAHIDEIEIREFKRIVLIGVAIAAFLLIFFIILSNSN